MKTYIKIFSTLFIGATVLFSCQQAEEPQLDAVQPEAKMTRAFGDKTPIVNIYVETNDVNPLNAGDYKLPNGKPYADIVEFFASNIHKETVNGVVRPTLYLNDKMTNLLENGGYLTYVKPLQDMGIKVLLTVLGDWQNIGVTSMNDTQADQFATILAYAVQKYGLDGIGFDNEYDGSPTTVTVLGATSLPNCALRCRPTSSSLYSSGATMALRRSTPRPAPRSITFMLTSGIALTSV